MNDDAVFIAILENLAQIHEPWLEAVRRNPAVYAPHEPYPVCCGFGEQHPIHTVRMRQLFDDNLEWMRAEQVPGETGDAE